MNQDGYLLHFIKNTPIWLILFILMLFEGGLWIYYQEAFIWDLLRDTFFAFLTSLGLRHTPTPPPPTQENKVTDGGSLTVINPPVDPAQTEEPALSKTLDEIQPGDFEEAVENLEEKR